MVAIAKIPIKARISRLFFAASQNSDICDGS